MNKQEFNGFVRLIDDAYPKQKKLNDVQKGFFWLALKDEQIQECLKSLSNHTKYSEWKPQVCDITKNMETEMEYENLFRDYISRKHLKRLNNNKPFMNVIRRIGEKRIRGMLESEVDMMTEKFKEMYKAELNNQSYDSLPQNVKQKLVGLCKK